MQKRKFGSRGESGDESYSVIGEAILALEGDGLMNDDPKNYWHSRFGVMSRIGSLFVPCFEFGINPLSQLRKFLPYTWNFHEIPHTGENCEKSDVELQKIVSTNDFIWCHYYNEFAVTATVPKDRVLVQMGVEMRKDRNPLSNVFLISPGSWDERLVNKIESVGHIVNKDEWKVATRWRLPDPEFMI